MHSGLFLPVLALAVFFVGATEFMIAPLLTPIGLAYGVAPAAASWLISGYALAYAIGAPLIGLLARGIDRRRLLLIALALLAADGLAVAIAPSLGVAIFLRVLGGMAAAATIPAVFALIGDRLPRQDHARAMGLVMLGMTAGIALGPAFAGWLTQAFGWRAPFLASAAGCLVLLLPLSHVLRCDPTVRSVAASPRLSDRMPKLFTILAAKALWNGTAVAGFALSGEVLRQRFEIDTLLTGLSVAAFGAGLALGNVSVGPAKRALKSDRRLLVAAVFLLFHSFAAFLIAPLPLSGALLCLGGCGLALGYAAPASTALIAQRAGRAAGFVLALSESANNLVLLAALSVSALELERNGLGAASMVIVSGLAAGSLLLLVDTLRTRRQRQIRDGG
ncbi:MFS transporter [Nitratireductor sp. GISD-1A_MAKvit]|uniref:MFS transporter n=1 Tax=Nitratireductor sp. GISD-1A_MAKvit TaxID=3234198 RepID=UPI003466BC39